MPGLDRRKGTGLIQDTFICFLPICYCVHKFTCMHTGRYMLNLSATEPDCVIDTGVGLSFVDGVSWLFVAYVLNKDF